MSSSDVERWLREWPKVAQKVTANPGAAHSLAKSARVNVGRARKALSEGDLDAAVIWAENALINGADAVLQRDGVRVRGVEGAHNARLQYPALPKLFRGKATLITRARTARNRAQYEGSGRTSKQEAEAIVDLADQATKDVAAIV